MSLVPFLVSIPHSGEQIPDQTPWLKSLPEEILMCDVDRYVDRLYEQSLKSLDIPMVKTQWHRYAVDLNRIPQDVDSLSVEGNTNKAGQHNRGFHWYVTTLGHKLFDKPLSQKTHQELVELIYQPFHRDVKQTYARFKSFKNIYHLDAHSMPSLGTSMHRDPGQKRAEIVISDCDGTSCSEEYKDLVIAAYVTAGFKVGYNWPYAGGRVTEQYGQPKQGHHAIQVELNRELYMDEKTKQYKAPEADIVQKKIFKALNYIKSHLPHLNGFNK